MYVACLIVYLFYCSFFVLLHVITFFLFNWWLFTWVFYLFIKFRLLLFFGGTDTGDKNCEMSMVSHFDIIKPYLKQK